MGRRMTHAGVWISPAPGKDGGAINDQIVTTGEANLKGKAHQQDEQGFTRWRPGCPPAFTKGEVDGPLTREWG